MAQDAADSVTLLLFQLELARKRGDFKAAATAQDRLAEKGVRVTYGRPRRRRAGARS